jgi:tetratricopeptide (TPR) repeat protein
VPHATARRQRYFERPRRLSRSIIWELQRRFYDTHGVRAWQDAHVPFEISSNAYLARRYAEILLGFLRDVRSSRLGPADAAAPITIVELGSGSGRLAYLVTRALLGMTEALGWTTPAFRYVMTDFTERNVAAFAANARLAPLAEAGVLDFALFDAENPAPLRLRRSRHTLGPRSGPRPLALIANYLFDTVKHDAFRIADGRLYETRVGLAAKARRKSPRRRDPDALDRLDLIETHVPITLPYYGEAALDGVLADYRDAFRECDTLFPIGALRCLAWFERTARAPLFTLCGDKGYRTDREVEEGVGASLAQHAPNSFSTMVNFNAIERVVARRGGFTLHAPMHDCTFTVSTFLSAARPEAAPETRLAFDGALSGIGPRHYQTTFDELKRRWADPSVPAVLSLIRLAEFDQDVFLRFAPVLARKALRQASDVSADLADALEAVWQRYYPLSPEEPVAFTIGLTYFAMRRYREARDYFERALGLEGDDAITHYNIALASEGLGEIARAEAAYAEALARDAAYAPARSGLAKLRARLERATRR